MCAESNQIETHLIFACMLKVERKLVTCEKSPDWMSSIIFDIDLVHQGEPDPILTECHILDVISGSWFLTSKLVAGKAEDT